MSFASPLGLLALLAVPAVLALHLFRRRLVQRPVAAVFLWASSTPRADSGRRRSRVQNRATLWLELAAAALLALWLSGLRLGVDARVPHLVLVLDDTASMAARGSGGERTAAESARRKVRELVDDLPNDGVATVIRTGLRPEVLCGPRAPADEAARATEAWRPSAGGHDFAPAVDLAAEIAGPDGRLVLLTDRVPRGVPERFRVEAFGAPGPNAAVLSAARAVDRAGRETVYCDLAAWGRPLPARVRVEAADGSVLAEASVELQPGRAHHLALAVPRSDAVLTIRVDADGDALPLDDACPLPPEPDRTVRLWSALDPDATARLDLPRVVAALSGVLLADEVGDAELRFSPAPSALAPGHHEVVIGTVTSDDDAGSDPWVGPFLIDRRSGLVEGVSLDGVVWTAGRGALSGEVLVSADSRPLLGAEEFVGGDRLRLHVNLDLARSNLTSSPDWPILLANVVEHVRARLPGVVDTVVPVGGVVHFRGDGIEELTLVGPDGTSRPARGIGLATWEAREPGLFRIERSGRVLAAVGVQFVDPSESDLGARDAFVRAAVRTGIDAVATAGVGAPGRLEARVLALLLLLVLCADWWALRTIAVRSGGRA